MAALEVACAAWQQASQEAEEGLKTFITHAPEALVILDVETLRFVEANPAAEQLFGCPRSTLLEVGPFSMSPPLQPDGPSSERGAQKIAEAVAGGVPVFQWWHLNARGERVPCQVCLVRARWRGRDVVRATVLDITSRKKLEVSERGRRQLLDCIAKGASLQETLAELIHAIEDLLPGMMCSALLLDPQGECLRLGAAPSLPDFYNTAVDGLRIGPTAGSCGAAAFSGQRVIASDIARHPNWTEFRPVAEQARLRSCWSEPIRSLAGEVLGTFAMYYRESGEPAPVELAAIEIAAQLAAVAIEHAHAQQMMREMNQILELRVAEQTTELAKTNQELKAAEQDLRLSAVAFDTHDAIVITDRNGEILRVNQSFSRLTGYAPDEVIGKTPRVFRSGRHDEAFYRAMWRAIREEGYWQGEVWNRRKDGQEYLQRLTITCVRNAAGETVRYVGVGQDITEEKRAAADRAAIAAAHRVQESLFPPNPPRLPNLDIAGALRSADLTSGDFFDFMALGPASLGVLIADVSGHGLGPALLMAQVQAYLHALAECHDNPGELLTHANRLFALNRSGHFVTLLLCRLDAQAGSLVYAAAGHQGFLVRATGEVRVLESTSVPLGLESNVTVPCGPEIDLVPDDILVLLTDGIEEASNPEQEMFGLQRALDVVRENRTRSAAEIVEALLSRTTAFLSGAPQTDDITAVVVKVLASS